MADKQSFPTSILFRVSDVHDEHTQTGNKYTKFSANVILYLI
jgi:hypothetical protein